MGLSEKGAIYKPGGESSPEPDGACILIWLPAFRNVRKQIAIVQVTQSMVVCYGGLSRLRQTVTLGMAGRGQMSASHHGNRINRIWQRTHLGMWEAKVNSGSESKSVTRRCYAAICRFREQRGKNNSEGEELNFCFWWVWWLNWQHNHADSSSSRQTELWIWWLREMTELKIWFILESSAEAYHQGLVMGEQKHSCTKRSTWSQVYQEWYLSPCLLPRPGLHVIFTNSRPCAIKESWECRRSTFELVNTM